MRFVAIIVMLLLLHEGPRTQPDLATCVAT